MPSNDRTIENAVCLGCGCLCDDVRIHLTAGKVQQVHSACDQAEQWVKSLPTAGNQPATTGQLEAQRQQACKLLEGSQRLLVCGLKGVATNAVKTVLQIADQRRACVDWTTSAADLAGTLALQTAGHSGASSGEIAQRADLVLFWQCDPAATHPCHLRRLRAPSKSNRLPAGPAARTLVTVGPACQTSDKADLQVPLVEESTLTTLQMLRAALSNQSLDVPIAPALQDLARRIQSSQYVAIYFDQTLCAQGPAPLVELTLLAQQAHATTRVVTAAFGNAHNGPGADAVMTWQTGYPLAVSFARGYPDYGPRDFNTQSLLERGEVDGVLVASAAGLRGLSEPALNALRQLPSVVLQEPGEDDLAGDVVLAVAPLGTTPDGDVMRSDGMLLPLRHRLSELPGHGEVLGQLAATFSKKAP